MLGSRIPAVMPEHSPLRTLIVFLPNFARRHRRIPASSLVPISGWLSSIATFEGVGFTAAAAVVAVGAVGAADGLGLVGAVPLPPGAAPLPEEPPA